MAAFDVLDAARNSAWLTGLDALTCQAAAYQAKLAASIGLDPQASARELAFAETCMTRLTSEAPLLRVDLLEARGLLAQASGDLKQAETWHRQALELRRQIFGVEHPDVTKSLHNLANTLAVRGDAPEEALALFAEALNLRQRIFGPNHASVADVLVDQADHLPPEQARISLARALKIFETAPGGYFAVRANVLVALARLDLNSGDLDEAKTNIERASALQEKVLDLPERHIDRAHLLHVRGAVALRGGDFDHARHLLSRALEIYRQYGDADAAIEALLPWIEAAYGQRDYSAIAVAASDAGQRLLEALAERPAAEAGKFAWYIAAACVESERAGEAVPYFRAAISAYEELGSPGSVAEIQWSLAQALDQEGSTDDARDIAEASLSYYREQRDRSHAVVISRWLGHRSRTIPHDTSKQ